jgi:iron-sulfur cluster assembly protein
MMVVKTETHRDETTEQVDLTLTDSAVSRVRALLDERQAEDHALRVFISGGGCSGFQYGMALESNPLETDHRYEFGGIPVVVDPQSMGYLVGATIDYEDDLMGGGFKIENPNAVSTCGCGHSFKSSSEGGASHAHGEGCGCH